MKRTLCGILLAIGVIAGASTNTGNIAWANTNTNSKDQIGYQASKQADKKVYPPKPIDIGDYYFRNGLRQNGK